MRFRESERRMRYDVQGIYLTVENVQKIAEHDKNIRTRPNHIRAFHRNRLHRQ